MTWAWNAEQNAEPPSFLTLSSGRIRTVFLARVQWRPLHVVNHSICAGCIVPQTEDVFTLPDNEADTETDKDLFTPNKSECESEKFL